MFQVLFDKFRLCAVPRYRSGCRDLASRHLTLLNIGYVAVPVHGIGCVGTGSDLYSIFSELLLDVEHVVRPCEGHVKVLPEEILIVNAYLNA